MDHLVQFTISIDDAHIAKMVEDKAARTLSDEVLKKCKVAVGEGHWNGFEVGPALKNELEIFFRDNKDAIIEAAADKLAEKMIRTKAVKEAVKKVVEEAT